MSNQSTNKTTTDVEVVPQRVKTLGLTSGLSIVIGCIVGSGIYISVGETLKVSPPSYGLLMVYWTIGGIVSLIGGMCYVELGCMVKKSGGERTYLAEAFGYRFGVTFTYGYAFIVKSITLAAVSLTTGKYFVEMFLSGCQDTFLQEKLVAVISLLIVFCINCLSNNAAAYTQIFFTVIKLVSLVVIIITGFVHMGMGNVTEFVKPFQFDKFVGMNLGIAFINILWSFEGWNTLGPVVGEMRNPERDLPISICVGVVTVVALYCCTITSYISVLGYNVVQMTDTVAVNFAVKMYKQFSFIIPIFICCSTFGATNGNMISVARVTVMSGYEGDMPRIFSLLSRTKRTPVISLFTLMILSCCFVPFEFQQLLKYCAFVTWMFYFMTMTALIYLKISRKNHTHKFKVPIFLPIILMLVAVFVVGMSFYDTPIGCGAIFILIVSIFAVHWLPSKVLKPKFMIRAHDCFANFLMVLFDLEYADHQDVS